MNTLNTFLFDLDGTMLRLDNDTFERDYFKLIYKKFDDMGLDAKDMSETVWIGTKAMFLNNGADTNENVFWKTFNEIQGKDCSWLKKELEGFYLNEFHSLKRLTSYDPALSKCLRLLREKGYCAAVATNPLFPLPAVHARLRWAGIDLNEFKLITSYETSTACKPNPKFYLEILDRLQKSPEECIMIGNDVNEDMCAVKLGMQGFLLTDCLINKKNEDISKYSRGGFNELFEFISTLPDVCELMNNQ